jgi:group II intron reverse transcriptase/maturase
MSQALVGAYTKGEPNLGLRISHAADQYLEGEGNEAEGEVRQEVVVARSTYEAGEPDRRDPGEGRGHLNKGPVKGNTVDAQEPRTRQEINEYVLTKRHRIAEVASKLPSERLVSLSQHIDIWWLYTAFEQTRKDGAKGIDGQTAEDYQVHLRENLKSLVERVKNGSYKAPPVRRVYIPKGSGNEKRPIGIPTFEDKVLQRAVVLVLESIYEQGFHDFSYGFRPRKNQHQALERLRDGLMENGGGWVIDLDIRKFFDTLDHAVLREILDKRIGDGVIRKLIDKWLKAGVMESGELSYREEGTPQGGVVSPILSNIYLHEVLDEWFVREVQPRIKGKSFIVRFADDAVLGFETLADAERVMAVLPKRFAKYGLTVHPEKTKLLDMRKPRKDYELQSFTFLGFCHYWGKSRNGYWVVKQKTDKGRLARSIKAVTEWLKKNRHSSLQEQQEQLVMKMLGHYAYYGITGNFRSLALFRREAEKAWYRWLRRRSRNYSLTWQRFDEYLLRFPLPEPRIVHSYV